jgi:SAM-dependent methyltransferase
MASTAPGNALARLGRFLGKVRKHGPRGVYLHFLRKLPHWEYEWADRYLDRKYSISTAGEISRAELGLSHPEWNHYAPSYYGSLRRIFAAVPWRGGDDVFVDFGSGLGRVLVYAALRPMKRVIGVEYSAALNGAARRNLANARGHLRCDNIEIVEADAASYAIPDDATVLFFGNPFTGSILDAVLGELRASLMRAPRRIYFVSHSHEPDYPFEMQVRACPWLERVAEVSLLRGYNAWIYTNSRWTDA